MAKDIAKKGNLEEEEQKRVARIIKGIRREKGGRPKRESAEPLRGGAKVPPTDWGRELDRRREAEREAASKEEPEEKKEEEEEKEGQVSEEMPKSEIEEEERIRERYLERVRKIARERTKEQARATVKVGMRKAGRLAGRWLLKSVIIPILSAIGSAFVFLFTTPFGWVILLIIFVLLISIGLYQMAQEDPCLVISLTGESFGNFWLKILGLVCD